MYFYCKGFFLKQRRRDDSYSSCKCIHSAVPAQHTHRERIRIAHEAFCAIAGFNKELAWANGGDVLVAAVHHERQPEQNWAAEQQDDHPAPRLLNRSIDHVLEARGGVGRGRGLERGAKNGQGEERGRGRTLCASRTSDLSCLVPILPPPTLTTVVVD